MSESFVVGILAKPYLFKTGCTSCAASIKSSKIMFFSE